MHRPSFITGSLLVLSGGVALGACGSSSPSSTTTSTSSSSTTTSSISVPAGSSFCTQVATAVAQFGQIGSAFRSSPGAVPSVATIKQTIAAEASLLDSLDSSAPSQIKSAFDTLRNAVDQANSQVQNATTLQDLSGAFSSLNGPAISSAGTAITSYLQSSCGAVSSSST